MKNCESGEVVCSYCGCEFIEPIGRFMEEHADVITLAGELRRAIERGDPIAIAARGKVLTAALTPHTQAEEVGLFTVMREHEDFTDHIDTLCSEHADLDDRLERVLAGDHDAYPEFELLLRRHIDKEENGLFPASAIALDGPDWERVVDQTPPPAGA